MILLAAAVATLWVGALIVIGLAGGPSQATVERALASTEQVRINGSWQQVTEARPGWAAEELVRDAA